MTEEREFKFYQSHCGETLLELSDRHVLWEIKVDAPWEAIEAKMAPYFEQIQKLFEVELFFEGRSGRHICIEDTPENRKNYPDIVNAWKQYEDEFIKECNALKPPVVLSTKDDPPSQLQTQLDRRFDRTLSPKYWVKVETDVRDAGGIADLAHELAGKSEDEIYKGIWDALKENGVLYVKPKH